MYRYSFNQREITKIKSLHKAYGLKAEVIAVRFGCSSASIRRILNEGVSELGTDIQFLQKCAPQQFKALAFINRRMENYKKFPTDQQLKDHLGYRRMASVQEIKNKLYTRGWLDKDPDTFAWHLAKKLPKHADLVA